MSELTIILVLSALVWYCVDRFKPTWSNQPWGKYVTTAVAGALGAAVVFGYNLDLINALGIMPESSIVGQILTVLSIMCGSSAISEIIARIKLK